ncbi:MAG: TVP38/TMEM64 family protein [Clostridia bacterium]|nr:TVP38/TMEM64 family protein [Clostridia bacterium]
MKKWLKIFLVIFCFAAVSVIIYLILKAFNLTSVEAIRTLVSQSGKYGILVYTLITTLMLVFLCFVPLLNTSLAILGIAIVGSKIAFIANMIAVFFSTSILFFIGDKLGEKFAAKLIGKKALEETQDLIHHKSKFWLPVLFITPAIPDEAICLVAGMTKIRYWYLTLVSVIYHAIEIGLFCFLGSGIINWSALSIVDWFVIINLIIIDLHFLFKPEKELDKNNRKK